VLGDPASLDLRLLLLLPAELLEQLLERLLLPHLLKLLLEVLRDLLLRDLRLRVLVQRVLLLRVLELRVLQLAERLLHLLSERHGLLLSELLGRRRARSLLPQLDALLDALLVSLLLTHLRGGAHTGATFRESSNR
jgi:hypothetical protein